MTAPRREAGLPNERRWEALQTTGATFSARTGHTVVEHGGALFLFGGTDKRRRQQDLFRFDLAKQEWSRVEARGAVPSRRSGSVGTLCNGKMYTFGGYDGRDGNYFNDVHEFDFETLTWALLTPRQSLFSLHDEARSENGGHWQGRVPCPRTDHCMVSYNNSLIIFGGYDGRRRFNDTFAFDLARREWCERSDISSLENDSSPQQRPSKRFGHSGVVHNHKLWVFGGWDGQCTLSCVWALDLKTNVWSSLAEMRLQCAEQLFLKNMKRPFGQLDDVKALLSPRPPQSPKQEGSTDITGSFLRSASSGLRKFSDKLLDKEKSKQIPGSTEACSKRPTGPADLEQRGWEPRHRYRHSAVVHENKMVVFGGVDKSHNRFNDICVFDFDKLVWTEMPVSGAAKPSARTFHRAVCVGDQMLVMGGYDGEDRLNDMHAIHLGKLGVPSLLELSCRFVRCNMTQLAATGELEKLPPTLIESCVWTRGFDGILRGACREDDRVVCQRLALEPGSAGVFRDPSFHVSKASPRTARRLTTCATCGRPHHVHEAIREESLLPSGSEWQPDTELAAQEVASRTNALEPVKETPAGVDLCLVDENAPSTGNQFLKLASRLLGM
ncbi:Leucine-zipper-like transcriptional regulator 1 homolog [Durusdinium trenchii]|uniref:Leucine-zipper-like transcriptional regulator 1 homolog n=1 Tax=Durusdinium trenchii TaxID=1381693 RepID=A0ABP0K4N7_9DINO